MLCRDDAYNYGDKVYYMENNKVKNGEIDATVISEDDSGVTIKYKINNQISKYKIPHKRVAKTEDHLSQKIFGS